MSSSLASGDGMGKLAANSTDAHLGPLPQRLEASSTPAWEVGTPACDSDGQQLAMSSLASGDDMGKLAADSTDACCSDGSMRLGQAEAYIGVEI